MIFRLENAVQRYAWGSTTGVTEVFGIPNPSGEPVAEIWMGAHPKAPSRITVDGRSLTLDSYIAADPAGRLGADVAARFDNRLPFLFKILAAAEPLSIQAHPSKAQAEAGYAREESSGIARDAVIRNYRDDNHKPELIYALTQFWGLRGFRSPSAIAHDLGAAGMDAPDELLLPQDDGGLPRFFESLMTLPKDRLLTYLATVVGHAAARWPDSGREPAPGDADLRHYWVRQLAAKYPGDPGVLAPLFLNVFCLAAGEATYQPAGVLHAYLRGVGAELMANSDNVLRGGLTPKHVDLAELLAVGVFRTEPERRLRGVRRDGPAAGDILEFPTPFSEFRFSTITLRGVCRLETGRPQILLCSRGPIELRSGEQSAELAQGDSVFVPADGAALASAGRGTLLCATTVEGGPA